MDKADICIIEELKRRISKNDYEYDFSNFNSVINSFFKNSCFESYEIVELYEKYPYMFRDNVNYFNSLISLSRIPKIKDYRGNIISFSIDEIKELIISNPYILNMSFREIDSVIRDDFIIKRHVYDKNSMVLYIVAAARKKEEQLQFLMKNDCSREEANKFYVMADDSNRELKIESSVSKNVKERSRVFL